MLASRIVRFTTTAATVLGAKSLSISRGNLGFDPQSIRALSFDVTGTLLVHREPIMKTYAEAAVWARLPDAPTETELKPAFKQAYKESLLASPCFGGQEELSSRQWWVLTVRRALELCGRGSYTEAEFNRFFRRVYQHYGSPRGYATLPDAVDLLQWLSEDAPHLLLGITSNTPARTMETVLPLLSLHDNFQWFVCSQDVGFEKPSPEIFQAAFDQAQFWMEQKGEAPLEKHQVLHIGDSLESDFCGAKAFGFEALLLDRSNNPRVTQYQDWLEGPDFPGKTEETIAMGTIKDLGVLKNILA